MRWPWSRNRSGDQLVVSWSAGALAYVYAVPSSMGGFEVRSMGVEHRGEDSLEDFARRLASKGLKGLQATAMLRPSQYQFLQIDAPNVPPEELRAAARYQIKELVDSHMDDITLDVLKVGDGAHKSGEHLFVVAAANAIVRDVLALSDLMKWDITVIDIQETAQRNLQNAMASKGDSPAQKADALLTIADDHQAVLTISANDELFYSRRLELSTGFLVMPWAQHEPFPAATSNDGYMPVGEYIPDLGSTDFSAANVDAGHSEPAQRFLVEVQRSLDLWDRSWSSLPLNALQISAGQRTEEMAAWLSQEMGQSVNPLDIDALFPGFSRRPDAERLECLPLLGILLRTETRKL